MLKIGIQLIGKITSLGNVISCITIIDKYFSN